MGDMNDEPHSVSMIDGARAQPMTRSDNLVLHHLRPQQLVNLTLQATGHAKGTHCHRGHWALLDQVLVNGCALQDHHSHVTAPPHIHHHGPLLYKGRPNRWYSDHLPIGITLNLPKK